MIGMFQNAAAFDQDLGNWDLGSLGTGPPNNPGDGTNMLKNSGLSIANWEATIKGWRGQGFTNSVTIDASGLVYCDATERNILNSGPFKVAQDTQGLPEARCKEVVVELPLDANGQVNQIATADLVDDGSYYACGDFTLSVSSGTFTVDDIDEDSITITLTATDINDAIITSECEATVKVVDEIPPTANCTDITVELDGDGDGTADPAEVGDGSTDNTDTDNETTLTFSLDNEGPFDCSDLGDHPVILTVTDKGGNMAECGATVTVEDKIVSAALCKDVILPLDTNGTATLTPDLLDDGSYDACGDIDLTVSDANGDAVKERIFTTTERGANEVTLTVTDPNGNTNDCTATVTVEDITAICRDITVELGTGSATIATADVDNGSFHSNGSKVVSLSLDRTSFGCSDIGQNTVTLTATDNDGNTANCTATVTVTSSLLAIVTSSGPICPGSPLQLNEISGLGTSWSWTSNGNAVFNDPTLQNPEVTNVSDGEGFTVTVTLANGCTGMGTTTAAVLDAPVLETQGEQDFCTLDSPMVADLVASGDGTVRWYSDVDGTAELEGDVPLKGGTIYYGLLEDGNGCTSERVAVVVSVTMQGCDELPEADKRGFSPNGDGVNDTFSISWLRNDYPNYTLRSYDRNGSLVYEGNIGTPDWDGSASQGIVLGDGKLPNGVYYYTIDFGDGTTPPVQGIVYLNR